MKSFILSLLSVFALGLLASAGVNASVGAQVVNPIDGAIALSMVGTGLGVLNYCTPFLGANMLYGGLQKEVWIADIMDNLFNGAEFIVRSIDDSAYVNNLTVNVPQAGSKPSVTKNRAVFPATIAERTDTILTYNIDNFTTDPILVRNFDQVQISYDKRQSVIGEHQSIITERFGDEIIFRWSPTTSAVRVLRTTGGATGTLANATVTGTRNLILKGDIARLAKQLDKDNMPKNGRYLLMNADMFYELFEIDALLRQDYMAKTTMVNGAIDRLFGFEIFIRNSVSMYNNVAAGVLKAIGAADAATDCLGCLAWSQYAVRRAVGAINVYMDEDKPEYYGDVMSAEANLGGSKSRTDGKGIVALAQGYNAP